MVCLVKILGDITPRVSIYYTTDRNIPTSKSTLYTRPTTIKNNAIIAMVSIDSSRNSSQVLLTQYIIFDK